jgi:hypothetical protein
LLLCSSYLPLGVSNWTVIYIINTVPHQSSAPLPPTPRVFAMGNLELLPELPSFPMMLSCAGAVMCFADVSSATSRGSVPSWLREHCLAMPWWYLLGAR